MTLFQIVAGILGVALVTAGLYIWGLRKAMGGEEDLNRRLLSACGSRVVKRLKKQPSITEAEAAKLIEGISVGPAWSRSRLKVENGAKFAPQVMLFLTEQLYVEQLPDGSWKLK